jgi:hypothetical protein
MIRRPSALIAVEWLEWKSAQQFSMPRTSDARIPPNVIFSGRFRIGELSAFCPHIWASLGDQPQIGIST